MAANNVDAMKRMQERLRKVIEKSPRAVGAIASRFFRESFTKQGWDDRKVVRWRPRKNQRPKDAGRAILVKTARLKRSIRVRKASPSEVVIGTNVPYARFHNDGGIMHRRPHGRRTGVFNVNTRTERKRQVRGADYRLPQRRFMGPSTNMNKEIDTWYNKEISAALKGR